MFAGMYIKIPIAIKNILTISSVKLTSKGRSGIGDKIHSERSVKYPNINALINCKSLFGLNLFFKIGIWRNTKRTLKITVVIPIFTPEASVKEYGIELIGVTPKPDFIERPTPSDITNNPPTNNIILLIHIKTPHICFKSTSRPVIFLNPLTIYSNTVPTKNAATIVPIPTLAKGFPINIQHITTEIITIAASNPTLTFGKGNHM